MLSSILLPFVLFLGQSEVRDSSELDRAIRQHFVATRERQCASFVDTPLALKPHLAGDIVEALQRVIKGYDRNPEQRMWNYVAILKDVLQGNSDQVAELLTIILETGDRPLLAATVMRLLAKGWQARSKIVFDLQGLVRKPQALVVLQELSIEEVDRRWLTSFVSMKGSMGGG